MLSADAVKLVVHVETGPELRAAKVTGAEADVKEEAAPHFDTKGWVSGR